MENFKNDLKDIMKLIKGLLMVAVAVLTLVTSCSGGGSSFSAEKCAALEKKISAKEDLTSDEITEMVNQLGAIVYTWKAKNEEFAGDKEKEKEFSKSEEGKKMAEYFLRFGLYIDSHGDQLSNSDKRKVNKIMEEFKEEEKK